MHCILPTIPQSLKNNDRKMTCTSAQQHFALHFIAKSLTAPCSSTSRNLNNSVSVHRQINKLAAATDFHLANHISFLWVNHATLYINSEQTSSVLHNLLHKPNRRVKVNCLHTYLQHQFVTLPSDSFILSNGNICQ